MTPRAYVLLVDDEPRVLDEIEACLAMGHRVPRAERREAVLARHRERTVARIAAWRIPWVTPVVDAHIIVGREAVREIGRPRPEGIPPRQMPDAVCRVRARAVGAST
jgi:hypothetical protein